MKKEMLTLSAENREIVEGAIGGESSVNNVVSDEVLLHRQDNYDVDNTTERHRGGPFKDSMPDDSGICDEIVVNNGTNEQSALKKEFATLVDCLNPEPIIELMLQDGVSRPSLLLDIRNQIQRSDKNRKLLEYVDRRGKETYRTFKDNLHRTRQGHLAILLDKAEKNEDTVLLRNDIKMVSRDDFSLDNHQQEGNDPPTEKKRQVIFHLYSCVAKMVCQACLETKVKELTPKNQRTKALTLDTFLRDCEHEIRSAEPKLDPRGYAILYPPNGKTDLNHWDTSLLCCVLQQTCSHDQSLIFCLKWMRKQQPKIKKYDVTKLKNKFLQMKECILAIAKEAKYDDVNISKVSETLQKLELGVIPGTECAVTTELVCEALTEAKIENKCEHMQTREILEKGLEKTDIKVEKGNVQIQEQLTKMLDEQTSTKKLLEVLVSGYGRRNKLNLEATVKVNVLNCSLEGKETVSRKLVQLLNDMNDDTDGSQLLRSVRELQENLKRNGRNIVRADLGCIELHIQCTTEEDLISLLIDYVSGRLDTFFDEVARSARSSPGCEKLEFDTVIYEKEFSKILSSLDPKSCVTRAVESANEAYETANRQHDKKNDIDRQTQDDFKPYGSKKVLKLDEERFRSALDMREEESLLTLGEERSKGKEFITEEYLTNDRQSNPSRADQLSDLSQRLKEELQTQAMDIERGKKKNQRLKDELQTQAMDIEKEKQKNEILEMIIQKRNEEIKREKQKGLQFQFQAEKNAAMCERLRIKKKNLETQLKETTEDLQREMEKNERLLKRTLKEKKNGDFQRGMEKLSVLPMSVYGYTCLSSLSRTEPPVLRTAEFRCTSRSALSRTAPSVYRSPVDKYEAKSAPSRTAVPRCKAVLQTEDSQDSKDMKDHSKGDTHKKRLETILKETTEDLRREMEKKKRLETILKETTEDLRREMEKNKRPLKGTLKEENNEDFQRGMKKPPVLPTPVFTSKSARSKIAPPVLPTPVFTSKSARSRTAPPLLPTPAHKCASKSARSRTAVPRPKAFSQTEYFPDNKEMTDHNKGDTHVEPSSSKFRYETLIPRLEKFDDYSYLWEDRMRKKIAELE